MHVPWAWIKQRPHFLAEFLSEDYEVDVYYKYPIKVKKKNLVNSNNDKIKIKPFLYFPFKRFSFLRYFSFLNKIFLRFSISKKEVAAYDYVWLTSIAMYPVISHLITNKTKLIWDCMDNELEFAPIKEHQYLHNYYLDIEKELMKRADIIFCSSDYLSKKMKERTSIDREITIVNNAVELPSVETTNLPEDIAEKLEQVKKLSNVFMYIGAVSEWFDFESVIYMLENNPEANVVIIGPADVAIPIHDRIHYLGTVKRDYIFQFMENAKALIMPFRITELIRSVNPVKMYEYIYAHKVILVPYYEEMDKFLDYIHTYNSKQEFSDISKQIVENQLIQSNSKEKNNQFVCINQWKNRYQDILKVIK